MNHYVTPNKYLAFSILIIGQILTGLLSSIFPIKIPTLLLLYSIVLLVSLNRLYVPSIKIKLNSSLFFLFFCLLIISGYNNGLDRSLTFEKIVLIIYNIFIPILFYKFLFSNRFIDYINEASPYIIAISKMTILVSFIAYSIGYIEYFDGDGMRLTLKGIDNPIWFSRYLSFSIFAIIFLKKLKINFYEILLLLIACFLLYKSGSRAPFVILLFVGLLATYKMKKFKYLLLCVLICVLVYFFIGNVRIFNFDIMNDYSSIHRMAFFEIIFERDWNILSGVGLGNFGPFFFNEFSRVYPHNIVVEIFTESGLITLVIFSVLIIRVITKSASNIIYYFFLIALLNSFVSGDIPGNASLFIFLYISELRVAPKFKKLTQ